MIEIDDYVPVNAQETTGIKKCLQILQALPQQIYHLSQMDSNIVSRGLQPLDIFRSEENDLLVGFDC